MLLESAGRRQANQKTILLEMARLQILCPVQFERSGENRGGGTLLDHVETKHFDPWQALLAIQSKDDIA